MPADRTAAFDLHGAVGIRLADATAKDVATVRRQLGPLEGALTREPDLLIRFVDRLPYDGELRYLGVEDAAYTDTRYLILRGRHKTDVRAAIPFDRIGADGPCELTVERGLIAVPLLVAIANLTMFARGLLPLHAGGFVHDGLGILTVGWAKGGKSETLLAFAAHGADLVGDEWVYLDPATHVMRALPEPMRVWDWQIRSSGIADRIPSGDRRRLAATRAVSAGLRTVGRAPLVRHHAVGRAASRMRALVERQLSVQVPPERVFGRAPVDGATVDRIVFVTSHASDAVTIDPIGADLVARRATQSFLFEQADLLEHYRRFRFAFPDRRNPLLDELESRYEAAALAALGGLPAIAVGHPYPLEIDRLYRAIAPALA
jgi:hypothetical protein